MSFSGTKGYQTKPKPGVMINPLHLLSKGLIGYWIFNEGSGSLVNDISGKGRHGILVNMLPNIQGSGWSGSKFGGGLQFDNVDDWVTTTFNANRDIGNGNPFTISTRINIKSIDDYAAILHGGAINRFYFFIKNTNNPFIGLGNWYSETIDVPITLNDWHHFVCTYDGTSVNVYIDGGVPWNSGIIGSKNYDNQNSTIGHTLYHVNGYIDHVSIYNRVLSASEIKTLYQNPFCNLLQVPMRRYSVPLVEAIINQFQGANIGADLYNGVIIA